MSDPILELMGKTLRRQRRYPGSLDGTELIALFSDINRSEAYGGKALSDILSALTDASLITPTDGTASRTLAEWLALTRSPQFYDVEADEVSDDTLGLQEAIDWFKDPDLTNIPNTVGQSLDFRRRAFQGRVLDLHGARLGVTGFLNYDNAFGLKIRNGTLLVLGSASYATDRAVLEGLNAVNFVLEDVAIECNQLANGILANRCAQSKWRGVSISGCGQREYGFKSVTAFGGLGMKLDSCDIYGTIGRSAGSAVATYTATGILIEGGSDCDMSNMHVNRFKTGIHIQTGGWMVLGGHMQGLDDNADDVGLRLSNTIENKVIGVEFDHCGIRLDGPAHRLIMGCRFVNTVNDALTRCIAYYPTAVAQPIQIGLVTGNMGALLNTADQYDLVSIVEEGGNTADGLTLTRVFGNHLHKSSSSTMGRPRETEGTIDIDVTAPTHWRGNTVAVDLNNYILHASPPTATTKFSAMATAQPSSGEGSQFMGLAAFTAGIAYLNFTRQFSGRMSLKFSWGDSVALRLTAQAPVSGSTTQYEEHGTWTPDFTYATPGNLAKTFTSTGHYDKTGNMVTAKGTITTSAFTHTTASGALNITGLPYTSENTAGNEARGSITVQGVTKASYTNFNIAIAANAAIATIRASGSGQTAATIAAADTPTGGTVIFEFSITYRASGE